MSRKLLILALLLILGQFIPAYAQTIKVNDELRQLALSRKPIQTKTIFIIGTITGVKDTQVELFNGLVKIDVKNSNIQSDLRLNLPFTVLQAGQEILADVSIVRDGNNVSYVAETIFTRPEDEAIFQSQIQAIDPVARTVTLLNRQYQLDDETKIFNSKGKAIDFNSIKPDDILRISVLKVDQTLQAKKIFAFSSKKFVPGAFVEGKITRLDGKQISVLSDDISFDLSSLEFFGTRQGCPDDLLGSLKAGNRANLFARPQTTEPFKLEGILTNTGTEGDFTGKLEQVDRTARTITIAGQQIQITDETLLVRPNSQPVPANINMIKPGKIYSIDIKFVDGKLIATKLLLLPKDQTVFAVNIIELCSF